VLLLDSGNWPNLDELLEPEKAQVGMSDWCLDPFHNAKQGNCFSPIEPTHGC
jgi:hypothetical protein